MRPAGEPVIVEVGEMSWPPPDTREQRRMSLRTSFAPLGLLCCFVALFGLVWIDWVLAGGVFATGVLLWVLRVERAGIDDEIAEFAERYEPIDRRDA